MKPRTIRLAVLAAVTTIAIAAPLAASARSESPATASVRSSHVVGYFIEWGIYGRNYKVKDVKTSGSADRLTVINYAFGNVAPDAAGDVACKLGDEWADYQRPWTADESVTGEEVTWPRPILGNFQQLQAAEGPVPAPQGADLARWLDVVEVLLGRGSHETVARALRLVLHRPLRQGEHPGSGLGRNGRPRRRGRALRRNRRRLGVAGLRRERRQHHPARGQEELREAARGVPQAAPRLREAGGPRAPAHRVPPRQRGEDRRRRPRADAVRPARASRRCRATTSTARGSRRRTTSRISSRRRTIRRAPATRRTAS